MARAKSRVRKVVVNGPLAPFVTAYRAELHELGYAPLGIVKQLRQVVRLSRWLEQSGIEPANLTGEVLERFLAVGAGDGAETPWAPGLMAMLVVLRRGEVAGEAGQDGPASSSDWLLISFRRHLLAERGLRESTADRYVEYARRFLAERSSAAALSVLTSAEVTRCVQREAARVAVASTQYFVAGLRSFLRFCFVEGLVEMDLAPAALAVTGRRRSSLPKSITHADAVALLGSCDRRRGAGRRDYAVLLVLLRLGLRAGETAELTLDDIDWRAGQVVVHGKASRLDRLPLPPRSARRSSATSSEDGHAVDTVSCSCGRWRRSGRWAEAECHRWCAAAAVGRGSQRWEPIGFATPSPASWWPRERVFPRSPACCAIAVSLPKPSTPGFEPTPCGSWPSPGREATSDDFKNIIRR